MNRIAVLADIHGNLIALKKVVQDLERREVDLVVNLGDHLSGPLWPKETLAFLREQDWVHIRGNHDRQLVTLMPEQMGASDLYAIQTLDAADLAWLEALPPTAALGAELMLCHGSPSDDLQYLLETIAEGRTRLASPEEVLTRLDGESAPVVLCGHTHMPRTVSIGGQLLVNPGSVGLQAYDDTTPVPHVMETGSPYARYAILQQQADQWQVELIAVAYDHHKAAAQARLNGREDWARGLETGYFCSITGMNE